MFLRDTVKQTPEQLINTSLKSLVVLAFQLFSAGKRIRIISESQNMKKSKLFELKIVRTSIFEWHWWLLMRRCYSEFPQNHENYVIPRLQKKRDLIDHRGSKNRCNFFRRGSTEASSSLKWAQSTYLSNKKDENKKYFYRKKLPRKNQLLSN